MVTLALTPGCPSGIGPEIAPRALLSAGLAPSTKIIWCASAALLEKHAKAAQITYTHSEAGVVLSHEGRQLAVLCWMADKDDLGLLVEPGKPDDNAIKAQRYYLRLATELARTKKVQGLVTGPMRKTALADIDGQHFDGQTEFLHHFLAKDNEPPLMCFAGAAFLLGLATIHVPMKTLCERITKESLTTHIQRLHDAAQHYYGVTHPRITIFGLNPHAGEHGLIGDEEQTLIAPLIHELKQKGFNLEGPVAADGFFGHIASDPDAPKPHAVLAMYHDQGLSPYKLLCKGAGVNMTLGLSVPRTSPAHGTADALAGRHKAKPDAFIHALQIAERLAMV